MNFCRYPVPGRVLLGVFADDQHWRRSVFRVPAREEHGVNEFRMVAMAASRVEMSPRDRVVC